MKIRNFIRTSFLGFACLGLAACAKTEVAPTQTTAKVQGSSVATEETTKSVTEKIKVVCTTFPQYDWIKNIIGENADQFDLTLLMDKGVDLHNYQPTVEDISAIVSSDLFVYIGGESDTWAEDLLVENPSVRSLNLLEAMGDRAKIEEVLEGMEEHAHDHAEGDKEHSHEHAENEENHDHEHAENEESHDHEHAESEESHDHEHAESEENHDHEHTHEEEYDEHIWLSLKNANYLVGVLSDEIETLDMENAAIYDANAKAYQEQLTSLDKEYEEAVALAKNTTLVFADRFPFRYLLDDYDLHCYAAFVGCSAETEASFETVVFLASKVDEYKLDKVLTIDESGTKIADTVISNTAAKSASILSLNSMQSITEADVQAGANYIDIMKVNLEVLKEAMGL